MWLSVGKLGFFNNERLVYCCRLFIFFSFLMAPRQLWPALDPSRSSECIPFRLNPRSPPRKSLFSDNRTQDFLICACHACCPREIGRVWDLPGLEVRKSSVLATMDLALGILRGEVRSGLREPGWNELEEGSTYCLIEWVQPNTAWPRQPVTSLAFIHCSTLGPAF